jgi:hypothetical protein
MKLAVALIALFFAVPATADARTCSLPRGAVQNASSAKAIVYKLGPLSHQQWWACWEPTGRRTRLPGTYGEFAGARVRGIRMQGRYVAVARQNYDHYDTTDDDIYVVNMATGKRRYKVAGVARADFGCRSVTLDDFTVTGHGFVAWVASRWNTPLHCEEQRVVRSTVHAHDSRGNVVLEAGRGDVDGVQATRDVVSWLRDGIPRSARLR